jgi:hypothetical protein
VTARKVKVLCPACGYFWDRDPRDGQCSVCGGSTTQTVDATLADPRIEALIALGEAYAAEDAAYRACPREAVKRVGTAVWATARCRRAETQAALAAYRAIEKEGG